jgi:hypothetical protein
MGMTVCDLRSNDLDLVTEFRSLVVPVHQDTGCSERSRKMHRGVLSTDALFISMVRIVIAPSNSPCEDRFPKRGSFGA